MVLKEDLSGAILRIKLRITYIYIALYLFYNDSGSKYIYIELLNSNIASKSRFFKLNCF